MPLPHRCGRSITFFAVGSYILPCRVLQSRNLQGTLMGVQIRDDDGRRQTQDVPRALRDHPQGKYLRYLDVVPGRVQQRDEKRLQGNDEEIPVLINHSRISMATHLSRFFAPNLGENPHTDIVNIIYAFCGAKTS